jgi:hypothetical protein
LQEAGSKLSRDSNKASYRAFKKMILMVIELIRQFYDLPRCFRIMGEQGTAEFIRYANGGIKTRHMGTEYGVDMGYRTPLFDVEVTAQRQSPYSKMSQNELALQLYGAGFFQPEACDMALACIDMMDFDRKDFVAQSIAKNGGAYRRLMEMGARIEELEARLGILHEGAKNPSPKPKKPSVKESVGSEPKAVKTAKKRVAEAAKP